MKIFHNLPQNENFRFDKRLSTLRNKYASYIIYKGNFEYY